MRRWLMALSLLVGCVKPEYNRVEITYQTIETRPEQQALHQRIIAEFEKSHPQIHVRVIYDTSKFQKLNVQLAGGAAPDLFYYTVDRLPTLAQRGQVRDLTENFSSLSDQFFPEAVESCRVNGKLCLVPFNLRTDIL